MVHAPAFRLPDQNGKIHTLSDYRGGWLVVYFYPRDFTPGCTKEACGFQTAIEEFGKRNIAVVGISKDSIESHKKFADKYNLTFPLLSDPDHRTIEVYDAWGKKKFLGREYFGILRNTYVVDPKGRIAKSYIGVNPLTHVREILDDIDSMIEST